MIRLPLWAIMDRDHLTRLIDDPARVQRDDIADLKAMAERYPWFSGAHLLLAVGGHRGGDVLFDEQLKASAAHLPSRAVLFDKLQAPTVQAHKKVISALVPGVAQTVGPVETPSQNQTEIDRADRILAAAGLFEMPETAPHEGTVHFRGAEELPIPVAEKPVENPVDAVPPTTAELPPLIHEMPPVIEVVSPPIPAPPEAEVMRIPVDAIATPPAEPLPTAAEESPTEELAPEHAPTPWKERLLRGDRDEEELDRQMRDSAVAISYELLLESEGLLEPAPEAPVPVSVPEPVVPVAPITTEVTRPAPAASRSFSDWLSTGGTEVPARTPAIAKDPAPSRPKAEGEQSQRPPTARPIVDPEIIRAVRELAPVASKHTPENPETKALIDRFLQQSTQTPQAPKKAEFFNPQTAAKRSLEEHADLVTETLARIYEKQGNIAKAIAAYERLAVKHPEKSAHFRALAKALSGR